MGLISVDATSNFGSVNPTSPISGNHIIAESGECLVTCVYLRPGSSPDITAKYNAVSMTQQTTSGVGANGQQTRIFTLINPDVGTHAIEVTFGETPSSVFVGSVSFKKPKTGALVDSVISTIDATVGLYTFLSINTDQGTIFDDNAFVIDILGYNSTNQNATVTPDAGQTHWGQFVNIVNYEFSDCSYIQITPAGIRTMGWTANQNINSKAHSIIAIRDSLYSKVLTTETLTLTDMLSKTISRSLSEIITLTDSVIVAYAKILSETLTFTDSIIKTVTRVLSETFTFTDFFIGYKAKIVGWLKGTKSNSGIFCGVLNNPNKGLDNNTNIKIGERK